MSNRGHHNLNRWPTYSILQVIHAELEHNLRTSAEELEVTKAELQDKRALTEKLENDLLQLERRRPDATPSESGTLTGEGLLDLDFGIKKQATVGLFGRKYQSLYSLCS